MFKKILTFGTAALTAFGIMTAGVWAEEYQSVNLIVDGVEYGGDQTAYIYNSRTVVPIRVIAEAFDCDVQWIADTKTVEIKMVEDGVEGTIYLSVGSYTLTAVMGEESASMEMDVAPVIINGRTMVPISFISDLFGIPAEWDGATKTVTIETGSDIPYEAVDELNNEYMYYIENIDASALSSEQFERYMEIVDNYWEVGNNEEGLETRKAYVAEVKAFALAQGLAAYIGGAQRETDVTVDSEPSLSFENYNGEFSVIIDEEFDESYVSDDTILHILYSTNLCLNAVYENLEVVTSVTILEMINDYAEDMLKYSADLDTDNKNYAAAVYLNRLNTEIAVIAELYGIDLNEDLKAYDVSVENPVYASDDIDEIKNAYSEALELNQSYDGVILNDDFWFGLTEQQTCEYLRIDNVYDRYLTDYYDNHISEEGDIEFYRQGLKLLDLSNARIRVFAERYNIVL